MLRFSILSLLLIRNNSVTAIRRESNNVCLNNYHWLCPRGGGSLEEEAFTILDEIQSNTDETPLCHPSNLALAMQDFSPTHGHEAYRFLKGLALSSTFRSNFWHKQPLLIKHNNNNQHNNWISDAFTIDRDLKLIHGSYISGHKTSQIMRNGTKTNTWTFEPIKANPARVTTWDEVEQAMMGGTIYFNTAGSLWPTLGGFCRMTNAAFGLPANVNIYITPPGQSLSVSPHTDRQDVLVFQTQGSKRWKVYAPPKRRKGVDPLNRGKAGDVIEDYELGEEPILDVVIEQGDVLYVPTGFPHTTDTSIVSDDNSNNDTSVHLTMGLDTHVWGLTLAHVRWSVLQRCAMEHNINIESDDVYWQAMETIPLGFLVPGDSWKNTIANIKNSKHIDETYRQLVTEELKRIMILLEPDRWEKEDLPRDVDIHEVVEYMISKHLQTLMVVQEEMLSDISPNDDESMIKAYNCTQRQNAVMEEFGAFSKNEAMKEMFQKMRLSREEKANQLK